MKMATVKTKPALYVVLTGHSRGLGAALARTFLAQGAAVLGLARQRQPGLGDAGGARFAEVQLDLADATAVQDWLDSGALSAWMGGASHAVLVNNAGTVMPMGAVGTLHDRVTGCGGDVASQHSARLQGGALARSVTLNVTTPLMLTDAFVAASAHCADRRVVHVSSGAGRSPYPGWSTYCATKAALDMHARASQLDAVPGLRVASVAPGVIDTDMQAAIRGAAPSDFPLRARFVAMKQDGQLTDAADASARLVAYVLSDAFGNEPTPDLRQLAI